MAQSSVPPQPKQPRVLVAEDDPALRRLLELRLKMDGFDVFTAEDGQEALELLEGGAALPDIVVCDIMMPRISGLNVCRQLRATASTRSLPVILLSAHNLDPGIEEVLTLGNIAFMNKPFNASDLRSRIMESLTLRAAATVE